MHAFVKNLTPALLSGKNYEEFQATAEDSSQLSLGPPSSTQRCASRAPASPRVRGERAAPSPTEDLNRLLKHRSLLEE